MMKAVVGRWVLCTVLSVVTTWTLTSPAAFPFVLLTTSISALLSITLPGHRARHWKTVRKKSSWVQVQTRQRSEKETAEDGPSLSTISQQKPL